MKAVICYACPVQVGYVRDMKQVTCSSTSLEGNILVAGSNRHEKKVILIHVPEHGKTKSESWDAEILGAIGLQSLNRSD